MVADLLFFFVLLQRNSFPQQWGEGSIGAALPALVGRTLHMPADHEIIGLGKQWL
jgi:hypothetical protein